jgi:hypothetical protein
MDLLKKEEKNFVEPLVGLSKIGSTHVQLIHLISGSDNWAV